MLFVTRCQMVSLARPHSEKYPPHPILPCPFLRRQTTPDRLSAPIHNYGIKLAAIFFPAKALSVEWIRFLISFFYLYTGIHSSSFTFL
jgi:hypothetical protein